MGVVSLEPTTSAGQESWIHSVSTPSLEPATSVGQVLGDKHLIHSTISTLAILTLVNGRFYPFLLGEVKLQSKEMGGIRSRNLWVVIPMLYPFCHESLYDAKSGFRVVLFYFSK